jgi:hypothetical protein
MKTLKVFVLAGLSLILLSCVVSLQPLFEDRYLVFEPGLAGTWKAADSADTWTFEKAKDNEYVLIQRQAEYESDKSPSKEQVKKAPGDAVRFRTRLGRLGGHLFFDFIPADEGNPEVRNDWYNAHMIPAHTLARVWLEKDSLKIVFLDQEWISKALKSGQVKLAYVDTGKWLVITAPTKELRAFILKYAEDAKAFPSDSGDVLSRVK